MFSQFTTPTGRTLIVRAIDIRVLEDAKDGVCVLIWEPTPGQLMDRTIEGTSIENLDRLKREETDALIAAERVRQSQQRVERGMQSLKMVRK